MFKRYILGVLIMVMLLCSISFAANAQGINGYKDTSIDALKLDEETPVDTQTPVSADASEDQEAYPTLKLGSSGPSVVNLQCRLKDLGYYNYKVTGYYGELTVYAVKLFQKYNGIADTGTVGELTNAKLYTNDAARMPMNAIDENANRLGQTPTPVPAATKKPSSNGNKGNNSSSAGKGKTGAYYDWWKKAQYMMPRGTVSTVTDYYTGITYKVKRTGGVNHADCETVSSGDTANYKKTYGGHYNWSRRPVVVNINGTLVAGSINGMPHGYDSISGNNMQGQFCIHFLNSKTHVADSKDPQHQKCVRIAAGL